MSRFQHALLALSAVSLSLAPHGAHAQQFRTEKFDIGGTGGTDYLAANPATGNVYISRGTHVMIVNGFTGAVLGDIPDTPRVHGIAFAEPEGHGFTTNAGDSTLTMFSLSDNSVIRKAHIGIDGADGIWYDEFTHRILSINHSHPDGTVVVVDAKSGDVLGIIALTGNAPEGGASDGKGKVFINIEDKNAIDVIDIANLKRLQSWPIAPCDGPTGIAYDAASNRIFSGCSGTSVVVNATTGKVVAEIKNGEGVDALGWDAGEKVMYIPSGGDGMLTVVHQDSPDKYTVVTAVPTFRGAKTVAVDSRKHRAYVFTPEYGQAPAAAAPGGRRARGPIVSAWFISVIH